MPSTVTFYKDRSGKFRAVRFFGHARRVTEEDATSLRGLQVCAALSALSQFAEALGEESDAGCRLHISKKKPLRAVEWLDCESMQAAASALFNVLRSIAATDHGKYVIVYITDYGENFANDIYEEER